MACKPLQEEAPKGHGFRGALFLQVLSSHAASEPPGARRRTQRPGGAPPIPRLFYLSKKKAKSVGTRAEDKGAGPFHPEPEPLRKAQPRRPEAPGHPEGQRKSDRTPEPGLAGQRGGSASSPGRRPCHSAHSRVRSASARANRRSCTASASSALSASSQSSSPQLIAPCSAGGRRTDRRHLNCAQAAWQLPRRRPPRGPGPPSEGWREEPQGAPQPSRWEPAPALPAMGVGRPARDRCPGFVRLGAQ